MRDAKAHGATIQSELDDVIQAQKQRPRIADIDPALILKVRTASPVDKDDWARLGMTIVASDPDKTFILFADDAELQEFKHRVEAYQKGPPAGNKHPQYAGFVNAIEEIGLIAPTDRIGPVLRAEGFLDPAQFVDDQNEVLDIELWQPGAANLAVSIYRVELSWSWEIGQGVKVYSPG